MSSNRFSTSVSSSIYQYQYENGRRYHAYLEGKYPIPNDEEEKDRLDLQHHAFRLTVDGLLYLAPIPDTVQNVLDVGCGTGIWTIEFAEEHPQAKILGTDLSPIQPSFVPMNCSFLIDDADRDWVFASPFDYIHSRAMIAAFKNWNRFFSQAYANLKPGGYLEVQEFYLPPRCFDDPSLNISASPYLQWAQYLTEAGAKVGLDMCAAASFAEPLRAAGFVDIHAKHYKWPIGTWPKGEKYKLLGRFAKEDLLDWLPSSALALFTRVLKWRREEVEVFLASVRNELKERKHMFYQPLVFWYARKPPEDTLIWSDHAHLGDDVVLEADNLIQPGVSQVTEAHMVAEYRGPASETGSAAKPTKSTLAMQQEPPVTSQSAQDMAMTGTKPGTITSGQTQADSVSGDFVSEPPKERSPVMTDEGSRADVLEKGAATNKDELLERQREPRNELLKPQTTGVDERDGHQSDPQSSVEP